MRRTPTSTSRLFIKDGESCIQDMIDMVSKVKIEALTHELVDYLMGEIDNVPKEPQWTFKLYRAIGNVKQEENEDLAKIDEVVNVAEDFDEVLIPDALDYYLNLNEDLDDDDEESEYDIEIDEDGDEHKRRRMTIRQ